MTTLWTYELIDLPDREEPRRAWRTRQAARAAAQQQLREEWEGFGRQAATATEPRRAVPPYVVRKRLREATLRAGRPMPPLAWQTRANGAREAAVVWLPAVVRVFPLEVQ